MDNSLTSPSMGHPEPGVTIRYLHELRRRWWLILATTVACAAIGYLVSVSQAKSYTATSVILVRDSTPQSSTALQPSPSTESASGTSVSEAVEIIPSRAVQQQVRQALQGTLKPADLADIGTVTAARQQLDGQPTNIAQISVSGRRPTAVARIANTFATKFRDYRQQIDTGSINALLNRVNGQISALARNHPSDKSRLAALQTQAAQLEVQAGLQTGNVTLVDRATPPTTPVSPKPARSAAIGAALGLLLGLLIALVRGHFDQRVKSLEEIERFLGVPYLGSLEVSPQLEARELPASAFVLEQVRAINTGLRLLAPHASHRGQTVMIASAAPAEGKSTIARWLAAVSGASVPTVVVDADLRRGSLSHRMLDPTRQNGDRPTSGPGLLDVLLEDSRMAEVLQPLTALSDDDSATPRDDGLPSEGAWLIPAGAGTFNPMPILTGDRMNAVLGRLTGAGITVFIDTPALRVVADGLEIARHVDSVIYVVRLGLTTIGDLQHLRALIEDYKLPVAGVIVNDAGFDRTPGTYGTYGGGYGYAPYAAGEEPAGDAVNEVQLPRLPWSRKRTPSGSRR